MHQTGGVTTNRHEANLTVTAALREAAGLLAHQDASCFRVLAYMKAAAAVEELDRDIADVAAEGVDALEALPAIGRNLASAILEIVTTGRWSQLERMRGGLEPEVAFGTIPGVGPVLAHLIHEHLHVDTLQALEAAAHDGRLETVPGVGPRRAAGIRNALAIMLAPTRPRASVPRSPNAPPVGVLLDVDREYRRKAADGELRTIAPRRFNPGGRAWLPILHTEREQWHFTALYSNTALAHRLGRTNDWVVMFFAGDHQPEGQCTIVTETTGRLKGRRVVRGREKECAAYWAGPGPAILAGPRA